MTDPGILLAHLTRPVIVDLFCCEGAGSRGYDLAGFDVVGIDLFKYTDDDGKRRGFSQSRYPYPSAQMDALLALRILIAGGFIDLTDGRRLYLWQIAAFHGSPPCQAYSITANSHDVQHPMLIAPLRDLLEQTGKPYVIENVEGARSHLVDPVTLCWGDFYDDGSVLDDDGTPLRMERHRLFESNVPIPQPVHRKHDTAVQVAGSYGGARNDKVAARTIRKGGYVPSRAVQQRLLGVDWLTVGGMYQCLPPVYTEHVGRALMAVIRPNG